MLTDLLLWACVSNMPTPKKPDNSTGGYSNDHTSDSLLEEFAKSKIDYPTTNGPFAVGSGVKMARLIGAKLIDMDKVQVHPTGFVDPEQPDAGTKFLAAEALRGSGA
ncbi:putative fumarate reductase, partial [Trichinella spiralis]